MRPRAGLAALTALALLAGCHRPARPPPATGRAQRSFYYWRTTFSLSDAETDALAGLRVSRLFLRAFDVVWDDGGPQTVAPVHLAAGARLPGGVEVVPVVFLREEVFRRLPRARVPTLAGDVLAAVDSVAGELGFRPRELQLDCDWTDGTRDAFFEFTRELGARAAPRGITLSATIRLHQIKYRDRTGVPPVARGMLMFYNMGRFSADPEARAIFDRERAHGYLARVHDYPLPLDVALPIWSWTVHLRDGRVEGLLQSTDADELATVPFLRKENGGYVSKETTFLHGNLLREGDVLKPETIGPEDSLAAARMIAPLVAPGSVALFDLSERNVGRHGIDALERVYQTFR